MSTWTTEVCGYQGNVYTRDVGPNDTTVYMDTVYSCIPWLSGDTGQDKAAVNAAIENAEQYEEAYCPYCKCYEDKDGCGCE